MRTILLAAVLLAGAAIPTIAQTPGDNDPMQWAYDYAYEKAICDSSTPKERTTKARTDGYVNCQQVKQTKELLKKKGFWCVTNAEADLGVPCTPSLAK